MLHLKFVIADYMFTTDYYTSAIDGCTPAVNDYIYANSNYTYTIGDRGLAIDAHTSVIDVYKPSLEHFK